MANKSAITFAKVRVKKPIVRNFEDFTLDVSDNDFKDNPKKFYFVPNNKFWTKEYTNPNGCLILDSIVNSPNDDKKEVTPSAQVEEKKSKKM
jgi:hypothetical protein